MPVVRSHRRSDDLLALIHQVGVLRPRDLAAYGIARDHLGQLVQEGRLERVERGLYILPEADVTEHHTLVQAIKRVPGGVVCLLSALAFHHLTTASSTEVWLAIIMMRTVPVLPACPCASCVSQVWPAPLGWKSIR